MDNIGEIVSVVLLILTIVLGLKWKNAKDLLKELAEALTATSSALDDDDLTLKERKKLVKEWKDVVLTARKLIGRS